MPKIEPHQLVFVGVRDTEEEEEELIARLGIRNFSIQEVKERGAPQIALEIRQQLKDCDLIYLSFDVDSMDCDLISKGTGTPVPQGLSKEQAQSLIETLVEDPRTCCLEITEINPTLDNRCNRMAETAFDILEQVSHKVLQRGQQADPQALGSK